MSKVLVTGGAGFIGSHVVDSLVSDGNDVFVIDNLSSGKKENMNKAALLYQYDIAGKELLSVMEKERPEFVFHLAAQIDVRKSVADPIEDAKINILGSINVMESARRCGVKKIIFASSGGAIYGDTKNIPTGEDEREYPISPYGCAKLSVERYLHYYHEVFNVPYIALRFANVYGPRQNNKGEAGVVAIFCTKVLQNEPPVIYGDGKQTRDFVYVGDIVRANVLAMKSKKCGAYNVGTGKESDINTLAKHIKNSLSYKNEFHHKDGRRGEQKRSCLSFDKIRKDLGWEPDISLDEGIKLTAEWFEKNI